VPPKQAAPTVGKTASKQPDAIQAKNATTQGGSGTAKSVPPKQAAPTLGKTTSKQPDAIQAKNAIKQTAPVSAKAVPKQPAAAAPQSAAKPTSAPPQPVKTEPAPPAVAESKPMKLPNPGKRDPFLSPLAAAGMKGPGSNCSTGKRCLVVDQLVLKGIVQMKAGNFALVENIAKRPYVLHENDSLYNGSVVKITGDSVIFREESSDILGRPVSKEVVKKVSAPAV